MKLSLPLLLVGSLLCVNAAAQNTNVISCNLEDYRAAGELQAQNIDGGIALSWLGAEDQPLIMELTTSSSDPRISALRMRDDSGTWVSVLEDVSFEYRIVEGFRRISNQQLAPFRGLGVELTQEIVDRYKWDVFWDAPLDLREVTPGGNPPPADGVAQQPGLPRAENEIRRDVIGYNLTGCAVRSDGARMDLVLAGVTLGSFRGDLVITVFAGTNLIQAAVVATTNLPSVAYKYDAGLSGIGIDNQASIHWRDTTNQVQSYALAGPVNFDPVPLVAANRLVVMESDAASLAAFPPPHTFFWAREVEINVGYNWYRKDDSNTFSFGIRQGEQEVVERYLANWSLYSAPPGTRQQMKAYFYPSLGNSATVFDAALAFTNQDRYPALEGYKVMGSHYHTNLGRELINSGSMDTRLRDFEVLRAAGIDIAGPVDRPRDETQLLEQHYLFEGARRHSDDDFLVLPEMENSNLLGGHWDLLFSHPVYYVDERAPGTPLVTSHPEYGKMYNIGSAEDVMAMVEAENMLIYMPHPRTKGSTGYPDAVADSSQFLNDRYRGVGWRWGMGSDLSEQRLSEKRVIPLLDDMNNWIADTDLQLKYLLAITETYFKAPGDDIYANGPVSYLRLDSLPSGSDYSPIINALKNGNYFVSSGEVLIPEHSFEFAGNRGRLTAELRWSFPLDFIEVVWGDGEQVRSTSLRTTDQSAFGQERFELEFPTSGQKWVRFAAWDTAGNGAMTMPVRIPRPQ